MENKKNIRNVILGLLGLVIIAAVMFLIYNHFKLKSVEGTKHIVAEVILDDGTSKSYDINTDEKYLRGALEKNGLISGTESEYGLYVTTVDGKTTDESKQEWWCFTLNGGTINTSVDATPIKDGDHYEITLTVGW
ncbi:DUF4430 domain-containing protein [Anaerocolumna sedimenticola]|uniref:DUF4430 domain-containing protein n=1 Tax=Anaerocolumna sedimenticola TaxID=2696063 RepID=A0A6P1TLC8_9FIRM|nr:DUF4430 domain-containing protein [Anaerocolumna sedimenticola]QHQ61223.1 DUF4430 domain-containing protein [Anaerocolumna sedimenticola]